MRADLFALEVTPDGLVVPVEAPPCGATHCAQPCEPLRGFLDTIRSQGLSVHQDNQ
jgi:hypothetical protein